MRTNQLDPDLEDITQNNEFCLQLLWVFRGVHSHSPDGNLIAGAVDFASS
jgi:hypothetical protein